MFPVKASDIDQVPYTHVFVEWEGTDETEVCGRSHGLFGRLCTPLALSFTLSVWMTRATMLSLHSTNRTRLAQTMVWPMAKSKSSQN